MSVEPDSVNADLTRVAGSRPFWLDRRYFDLHLTGASPFERALQVVRHSSCSLENWHAPFRCFAAHGRIRCGHDDQEPRREPRRSKVVARPTAPGLIQMSPRSRAPQERTASARMRIACGRFDNWNASRPSISSSCSGLVPEVGRSHSELELPTNLRPYLSCRFRSRLRECRMDVLVRYLKAPGPEVLANSVDQCSGGFWSNRFVSEGADIDVVLGTA